MVTNLLGRRAAVDDADDVDVEVQGRIGFVVAVDADDDGFHLLIEEASTGALLAVPACWCFLSPA